MRIMLRTLVIFFLLVVCFCLCPLGDCIQAASLSDAFFEAESCARALRKDPKAGKNPPAWTACIEKFQAVYRKEPKGPLGASQPLQQRDALHGPRAAVRQRVRKKSRHRSVRTAPEKISGQAATAIGPPAELQTLIAPGPLKNEKLVKEPAGKTPPVAKGKEADKKEDPGKASARSSTSAGAAQTYRKGEECFRNCAQPAHREHAPGMDALHRAFPQRLSRGAGRGAGRREPLPGGGSLPGSPQGAEVRLRPTGGAGEFRKNRQRVSPEPVCRQGRPGAPGHTPSSRSESAAVPRGGAPAPPVVGSEREPSPGASPESAVEPRRAPAPGEEGLAVVEDLRRPSNPNYTRLRVYSDRECISCTAC